MALGRFIVVREDLVQDPITLISDGLLMGRLLSCELLLNHPSVSRVQAGIRLFDDSYYVFALRPTNPIKVNLKPLEGNQALAAGDVLTVGPFQIEVERADEALGLKVSLQIGSVVELTDHSSPQLGTSELFPAPEKKGTGKSRAAPLPGDKALDIFWDKRIREAGKMMRPSPLFPKAFRRTGKAQFNWMPTTDLASRWPVAIFIWGAIAVGLMSIAAAFWFTNAFAPGAVSKVHTRSSLTMTPAIAARANADKCTNCHSTSGSMDVNCASCHKTEAFVATVIEPHQAAGIGCASCHTEHRGAEFMPGEAALESCTGCHHNNNHQLYNGRRVFTPHGGTFGYPVVNAEWKWEGLSNDEWSLKKIEFSRQPAETDQQWRSKQFHALHVQRVHAVPGQPGNEQGELSCSSCHKTFEPIDRETPRTTCGMCHNGYVDSRNDKVLIAKDQPNCISCHVQHAHSTPKWKGALVAQVK